MNPFELLREGDWYRALTILQRKDERDAAFRVIGSMERGRIINRHTAPAASHHPDEKMVMMLVPSSTPSNLYRYVMIRVRWANYGDGPLLPVVAVAGHAEDFADCQAMPPCPHRLHVENCDGYVEAVDDEGYDFEDDCPQCEEHCDCDECEFGYRLCATHGSHPIFY